MSLQRSVIWAKSVRNPLDRNVVQTFNGDDIEAHREHRIAMIYGDKHSGRADDFALFAVINSVARLCEGA